ncbi:MAG: phytanoyl-CoA dioxygenase family protein [Gammaproteobacteria bacterium]|nr:phytanoyl-CoA dioxygenase family protein [Gammaproteobacteria bacterium]
MSMHQNYQDDGFFIVKDFLSPNELQNLREVVTQFHQSWRQENATFYATKAINSAYLTAKKHLRDAERETLFKFIGSAKLMNVVTSIIGEQPAFMNTQLFFDPVNINQKNYWHRDPQYHLSVDEQKKALHSLHVVHCRIALVDEPGVELVPGTHQRWDNSEEFDVRMELNGHKNYEDLASGVRVTLAAGDLLLFNANMIHRGIYGMDRLSLDILFCDSVPELVKFVDNDCLPGPEILEKLECPDAFENTIAIKTWQLPL